VTERQLHETTSLKVNENTSDAGLKYDFFLIGILKRLA
jgi:hypothetical protein